MIRNLFRTRNRNMSSSASSSSTNALSYDITIVGGSVMGSSIAYHLAQRLTSQGSNPVKICVVEKDETYSRASAPLSCGGIRTQFSNRANIQMSLYGHAFLKQAPELLHTHEGLMPDLQFNEAGYLFLATATGDTILRENHAVQITSGALHNHLLTPEALAARFPWLHTDDLASGSLGHSQEGWFDPWALLQGFRAKAKALGVTYLNGAVIGMTHTTSLSAPRIETVTIQHASTDRLDSISTGIVINAAGPWAGHVAHLAGLDLPVEPRKRSVFTFHCPEASSWSGSTASPLVVDPSGVYFRPEGTTGLFLSGVSPSSQEDGPSTSEAELDQPDEHLFHDKVWPVLAARVPSFECIKPKHSWAGFYDYNTLDQNGIIGVHPEMSNFYFANGFSGHGLQQSPAVGRALTELICDGTFQTIDLSCFSYDRITHHAPLYERNIV